MSQVALFGSVCSEATNFITANEKGTPNRVPFTENLLRAVRLGGLLDFAGANAGRADTHTLRSAIHSRANRLQIDIPATFRHVMGMADSVAELRPAVADFTFFCHKTQISFSTKTTVYHRGAVMRPVWRTRPSPLPGEGWFDHTRNA